MALTQKGVAIKPCRTTQVQALAPQSLVRRGAPRTAVVMSAAAPTRQQMSAQMKQVRSQLEEDEQLKVLMDGLRGRNADTADFAAANVKMNLVEVHHSADETDSLPLTYEPDLIADYWSRRPVSVVTRITQLMGIAGGFLSRLAFDALRGRLKETEVARAAELREIMTSLGPAYIKLGQALSIRPDLLSPAAMNELQRLCDKVPSFPTPIAMQVLQDELGARWQDIYADLTPEPIAAASLGQVYKGKLRTGEVVAVKVQRPGVLETVTIDLYIIRSLGMAIRQYAPDITKRADIVALLDEWASRFFEELDYVKEGQNAAKFAEQMRIDLPQVVVPATYEAYTSRRVLTTEWLDGEKLSQSKADDVGALVNVGVICYLKQLLETGFFHADPHPGNLIRTPDGRLAILDFGLMTQVDDDIKFGMIEAISHLIHRDYDAIVEDFVTLDFIPEGTDLQPILPVLAKVFDSALEGGGAKSINFQDLAADLAQITFDYPFRIPPYFALIIRAISTLEGIALVGNPDFAIVDEAYPYIARRLLTDPSPRLREALRYMVYGKSNVFDADRLIDLLSALEDFQINSRTAMGDTVLVTATNSPLSTSGANGTNQQTQQRVPFSTPAPTQESVEPSFPFPFPLPLPLPPFPGSGSRTPAPFPLPDPAFGLAVLDASPVGQVLARSLAQAQVDPTSVFGGPLASLSALTGPPQGLAPALAGSGGSAASQTTREALRFMLSPEGLWFRGFVMDEIVKSVDALSRDQLYTVAAQMGMQGVTVPLLLPGAKRSSLLLAPQVSDEDRQVVSNVTKIVAFLTRGRNGNVPVGETVEVTTQGGVVDTTVLMELLPMLPAVAREVLPEVSQRLVSRIMARLVRDIYA